MRDLNTIVSTPTVGGFHTDSNSGVVNMLANLSEYAMSAANLDSVNHIKDILLQQGLLEGYTNITTGDYHNYTGSDKFGAQLHQLNAAKLEKKMANAADALLNEAGSASLNPITGLTLPLLKLYWIENIFKDFFHTEVADNIVINRQIERVYMLDGKGEKKYIPEAFNELEDIGAMLSIGDRKLTADLLPMQMGINIMEMSGGSVRQRDEISRNFRISQVEFSVTPAGEGAVAEKVMVNVSIKPDAANNNFTATVKATDSAAGEHVDMLFGTLDFSTGILNLGSSAGKITGVHIAGTLSAENNMSGASVGWEMDNKQFVIPTGKHLNTGLTVERMKREKIVYNIDTQAKTIANMSLVLNQLKDLDQLNYLNNSRDVIKSQPRIYVESTFDCAAMGQYALTEVEYRSIMLKEKMDKMAERMKKILKNPNVFFAVIGNPEDVRLLKDISWETTQGTSVVGGCVMNYSFGLLNANHRFVVLSSDKCQKGELRMIVRPLTQDQISYIHFDFDFIISNDYRDPAMPNVPSVMTTDSYLTDEVTPIQGSIKIINNDL